MCDTPFDRAAWRLDRSVEALVDGRTRRARLVDSLVECRTLNRASKSRVRQLLGRPDRTSRTDAGARIWAYLVGPGSLLLDSEELLIIFDGSRVAKLERAR